MIAAKVVAGLICGYIVASLCESFFHRMIGHATPQLRRIYKKAGWVGKSLADARYTHFVVHHLLTFRTNHITQFRSAGERRRIDACLARRKRRDVIDSEYGIIVGRSVKSHAKYLAPTLPFFAAMCWAGDGWFSLGACAPLSLPPLLAQFVHPYLHLPYNIVLERSPLLIRLLAHTSLFRRVARHHWLHHKYKDCNFNLLLGGDVILGVCRTASELDIHEMRRIGLHPSDYES